MSAPSLEYADPPELVIRPDSARTLGLAGDLWTFRDLLRALADRDLRLRYRQTVLGVAWVVLQNEIPVELWLVMVQSVKLPPGLPAAWPCMVMMTSAGAPKASVVTSPDMHWVGFEVRQTVTWSPLITTVVTSTHL